MKLGGEANPRKTSFLILEISFLKPNRVSRVQTCKLEHFDYFFPRSLTHS